MARRVQADDRVSRTTARRGARAALVLGLAVSALGCQETVFIGTECAHFELSCQADAGKPQPPPEPPPRRDAAVDDAPEAGAPDASPDDFVPPFELTNPDFERAGGIDGDVVIRDIAQTILQVVPLPITTELKGWYACWPFSVTTDSNAIPGVSQNMGDYLSFVPSTFSLADFVAVRQNLPKPLPSQKTLNLLVQTLSDSGGANNLFLEVRGESATRCEGNNPGVVLGRSALIPDSTDWSPVCVSFEADKEYPVLLLKPAAEGGAPANSASLRLDSLQVVERCP